ncbi:MAG: glycosyltransferase, partial [Olsenella sp.]|nr:glycosyltransferase [Olsenella sp.]
DEDIARLFSMENCVAVVPYRDATQSGVIALALAYGVPVIASDTGGLREQLDGGNVGLFCEPGNTESLFTRMAELSADAGARANQARFMREYAKQVSAGYDAAVGNLLKEVECLGEQE